MDRLSFFIRQIIVFITALQLLNTSIGFCPLYDDKPGDFSALITGKDPTETWVEFIVEAKYGQQDEFTLKTRTDNSKFNIKPQGITLNIPAERMPLTMPVKLIRKTMPALPDEALYHIPKVADFPPPDHC